MDLHPATNPKIQCANPSCNTMLLPDETCPRCNPPNMRPPEEQLEIGRAWKDKNLIARAERALDVQRQQGAGPPPNPGAFRAGDVDDEDRVIELANQRLESMKPEIEKRIQAEVDRRVAAAKPQT